MTSAREREGVVSHRLDQAVSDETVEGSFALQGIGPHEVEL